MAKDDRHMIQLIYDVEENLIDCEYITDAESVSQFPQTFEEEFKRLSSISINSTVRYLSGLSDLPEELSELSNYLKLKKQCRKLHRRIRRSSNGYTLIFKIYSHYNFSWYFLGTNKTNLKRRDEIKA